MSVRVPGRKQFCFLRLFWRQLARTRRHVNISKQDRRLQAWSQLPANRIYATEATRDGDRWGKAHWRCR